MSERHREPWQYGDIGSKEPIQPTIGEQAADAIEKAAQAKTEALLARKRADRVFDRLLLEESGGSADQRRARASVKAAYIAIDDAALEAESNAIIMKAKADAWMIRFEAWRTEAATSRAEMNLR